MGINPNYLDGVTYILKMHTDIPQLRCLCTKQVT